MFALPVHGPRRHGGAVIQRMGRAKAALWDKSGTFGGPERNGDRSQQLGTNEDTPPSLPSFVVSAFCALYPNVILHPLTTEIEFCCYVSTSSHDIMDDIICWLICLGGAVCPRLVY